MANKRTYEELEQRVLELEQTETELKQWQKRLQESEERLKALSGASFEAIFLSEKGICFDQNQAAERMFGYTRAEAIGRHGTEWIAPKDHEQVKINMASGYEKPYEVNALKKDGNTFPCEIQARMTEYQGRSIRITALRDTSARKQAEGALRESESFFSQMFEQSTTSTCLYNPDGTIRRVNNEFCKMFGVEEKVIINAGYNVFKDQAAIDAGIIPFLRDIFEERKRQHWETNFDIDVASASTGTPTSRAGKIFLEVFGYPVLNRKGNLEYVVLQHYDITDRKQAEEALRESEDKFRSFAEQSLVGIYLISGDVFKYVNPKFAEIFGYSVDECLNNMHFPQLVHPEDLATVEKQVGRRLSGETKALRYSFRGIKKSGETIHVEIFGSSIVLKGKTVATGTMLEITERKRAEASLQREKENLSTTLDNNPHGIVLIDDNGKWIYMNPMFREITGYTPEDIQTGREWLQKAYPDADYRKKVIDAWKKDSKQGGKGDNYEFDVTCKDGQVKQIEFSTAHLVDRSVSVLTDVTQRKMIEKSLYEAKLFLDNISDLAYRIDNEGNVIYANPAAERITGLTLSEIIDRPLLPHFSKKNNDLLLEVYNKTLAGESQESILTFNSGIACHFTSLPFKDDHGNIIGTFGIARDISDRIDADKALKESEARLKKAQSVAKIGNWEYDISAGKIWGSEQAFRIYGIERTSPHLPLDLVEACIPDAPRVNQALVDLIQKNKPYDIEFEIRQEVGGQTIFIHSIAELVYENGLPIKVSGVIQDVTEQKRAEKERKDLQHQLHRAQKMEALGLLAGGVAHDLNNILSGIVTYPELLLMDLPEDSPLTRPIKTIQESGMRAVNVVADLLTIARGVATGREALNLNTIVTEYLGSPECRELERTHSFVNFKTELDSDLLNMNGSPTHIKKALMNLITNASEAIEGSGTVKISTANRYLDEPVKGYEDVLHGEHVVLSISDEGTGISPEDLEKIFEPFYTKKVMGRSGTGLGLAVVWNTVQDHKGYINVKSSEKGTLFELYFPVTREKVAAEEKKVPLENYLGNGEKILVVDDDERQREIAGVLLTRLGYVAEAVSSGEEAIEYLKEHPVDLIVLDMVMPRGIDGCETYQQIIKIRPGQKAIIASGYAKTKEVDIALELGAGKYIKKPYILEKMGLAVKEELEK